MSEEKGKYLYGIGENTAAPGIDPYLAQSGREQKMREALERILPVLEQLDGIESYSFTVDLRDEIALVHEALAPTGESSAIGLRDALEGMVSAFGGGGITESHSVRVAAIQAACEALAQQPAAVVELTDEELLHIHTAAIRKTKDWHVLAGLRAVIAAHEAKKNGGAV